MLKKLLYAVLSIKFYFFQKLPSCYRTGWGVFTGKRMAWDQRILLVVSNEVLFFFVLLGAFSLSLLSVYVTRSCSFSWKDYDILENHMNPKTTLYAILLGFVIVTSWQAFRNTEHNTIKEANTIASLYRASQAFPPEVQLKIAKALVAYVNTITDAEWKTLRVGERSSQTDAAQGALWDFYGHYTPTSPREEAFLEFSLRILEESARLRALRLLASHQHLSPFIWTLLLLGGAVIIGSIWFYGLSTPCHPLFRALLLSLFTALVGLMLLLVFALEYPFSGGMMVSNDAFYLLTKSLFHSSGVSS